MNKTTPDYSSLFYLNPLASWVYDLDTFKILDVNLAAIELYGYSKDEFLSLTLKDLSPIEDVPKLLATHTEIENLTETICFGIITQQKKSKENIRMKINGYKVDFLGKICMMVVCQDVTLEEEKVHLLKESEERLIAASSITKLGYWRLELDAKTLHWTDEVYAIWDRDKNQFEVNVENIFETIHPDDREAFNAQHDALSKGSKSLDFMHRIILPDKSIRWVHELGRLVIDENGRPTAFEGSVQDITESKNEIQRLRFLESVITNTNFAVLITEANPLDEPGPKIIYVNDAFTEMTGYSAQEIIGKTPRILQGPNTDKNELKKLSEALRKGESCEITIINYKKNGDEFWISIAVTPVVNENKQVMHFIAIERDITERKNKELELEMLSQIGIDLNVENELAHLYEAIPDILCLVDFQGRFLKMNKVGCELLGYSLKEILYHTCEGFVHPEDKEISMNEILRLSNGQASTAKFENRYITKRGDIIWLSWTGNSSVEEGLIYATAKNITEEKRLRELNRQASKLAKIGSWELDLLNHRLFWSDMVHQLHETDSNTFIPNLESGIDFYRSDFRSIVQSSVQKCISIGESFDLEAIIITAKNNERWVRVIGNSDFVDGKSIRIYGSFQDIHESKLLELQISEILGSISDAFYAVDKNWNFTYFNIEAERLLHRNRAEIIGLNLWEVFPEALGTHLEEVYFRVAETGYSESFEYLFPGDDKWYEVNAYPSNGGVSSYFKNIDERKTAAEKLRQAHDEKHQILESIGDAFFTMKKDFVVTYWNHAAEKLIGVKREDILGKNLWETFPNAVNLPSYTNYRRVLETNQPITFEDYYGVWLEVNAYPSAEGLSIFFRDITFRKEADIRLKQANERFEKVTEATNDAIWDWDIVNKTYYRSNGIEKFFGKKASKSMFDEDFWQESFYPDDLPTVKKSFYNAIDDPLCTRWESEYRILNDDGKIIYVVDRGVIVRDDTGKAIRVVGAMTDISERKYYESQLEELNKSLNKYALELERSNEELEQFAFITSHDLQEPLRMISSFMDLLKRKYGDQLDDKAHQYIYFAADGAKRMKQIILELLEYSRAGNPTEGMVEVDLNEILFEFKQLRRTVISEKSVRLNSDSLPIIKTYKAAISQVLHCLIDNAIKYSKDDVNPIVEVEVKEKETEWEFSVRDNGIGIEPKFFDKIFVVFQRLHNRDQYAGTGIGLSIAKKHVEYLKGKIWLQSTPGVGSVFYFTVPKIISED